MQTRRVSSFAAALVVSASLLFSGSASAQNNATAQAGGNTAKTSNRILYHNGPVMTGRSNVYFIWYGCWTCNFPGSDNDTVNMLGVLTATLGSTPYFQTLTAYPDATGAAPSGGILYAGAYYDTSYAHGTTLTEAGVEDLVRDAILTFKLPMDIQGIYVVVTSSDIDVPGLSEGRCQYHRVADIYSAQTPIAVIGNAARAPSICAPQFSGYTNGGVVVSPPTGNLAADAMASMLAHVLAGAITDPAGTGWYDRYNLENSDKCQNTFGATYETAAGGRANILLGGYDFLLQQLWVNAGKGYCGMHQ